MPAGDAERRACQLLLDYLSPAQRETYRAAGYFDVDKSGCPRSPAMLLRFYPRFRIYRLCERRPRVRLFTSQKRLARSAPKYVYCIHAPVGVSRYDELLSLKLLLEHDEPRFVHIAHRFALSSIDRLQPARMDEGNDPLRRELIDARWMTVGRFIP